VFAVYYVLLLLFLYLYFFSLILLLFLYLVAPHNVMITNSNTTAITNSTTVNNGDSLTLNCTAAGGPENKYHWLKKNTILINDSVVNITSVEATDGGLYECRVSNDAGNTSDSITINGERGICIICLRCDDLFSVDQ